MHVENAGRTPAKNLRLRVDPPFPVPHDPEHPGWEQGVLELNRVMNGVTVIKALTPLRSLSYYLAEADDIMGSDEVPAGEWMVIASYEDAGGRSFREESILELSHWRRAMVTVDPVYRIAKSVQAVAYEVKNKKLPRLEFTFPSTPPADSASHGSVRGMPERRRALRGLDLLASSGHRALAVGGSLNAHCAQTGLFAQTVLPEHGFRQRPG